MASASSNWRRYLRFWGPNVDADIDDELRYHIEMRTQDFLARGLSPAEARDAAQRLFGDPDQIARDLRAHDRRKLRDSRRADMLHDIVQDVRYGLRQLRNAPRFTLGVVFVLALGIGANSAIFSVIDAAFLRPLPFAAPERLVRVTGIDLPAVYYAGHPQSTPWLSDLQPDSSTFASVAGYATGGLNLVGGSEPLRATVTYITADFFRTLGRTPSTGRVPVQDEFVTGGPPVVVVSRGLAERQLGGERAAVGRDVTLNGKPYRVVGVMPADFTYPAQTQIWIPLALPFGFEIMAAFRNFVPAEFIARLAPGTTAVTAAQHVDVLRRHFRPKIQPGDTPAARLVQPLQKSLVADRRTALLVLMASAALLLIIACANVMNLVLVRTSRRERELAVRSVLGATRARVLRQLIVENLLLSLAAGIVAVIVATVSVAALSTVLPQSLADVAPPRLDTRVLAFTLILATVTSFAFGVWPAMGASRPNLGDAMKAGGWGATRRQGAGARAVLVVAEVSLAVMLLIGAGLMIESLRVLLQTDSGIHAAHIVTARLVMSDAKYPRHAKADFLSAVVEQLRHRPGVRAAATVSALPMDGVGGISLRVSPEEAPNDEKRFTFGAYLMASPGYFAVLGAKLHGEDLPAVADTSRRVAVINESMAAKLWPGQDAVGHRLIFGVPRTVIGVVADIRTYGLDEPAPEQMYFPMAEQPQSYAAIVARGDADSPALLTAIQSAVHRVDRVQPVYALQSMDDVIGATVAPRRTNTALFVIFGAVALLLAGVGVYSVLSFGVAERTREIGVRVALGAQRGDVLALVMRQGVVLTAIGVAIGLTGALALSRVLSSILYQVSPYDVRVFIAAPVVLGAVALLAVLMPAWRATRLDPMEALRLE